MPKHGGKLPGEIYYDLDTGVQDADVIMCLRLQRERMQGGQISSVTEYAKMYQVTRDRVRVASPDCLVMHPGPLNRGVEIDDIVADSGASTIHAQVENGIFVRMAALHWVFEPPRTAPTKPATGKAKAVKA